MSSPTSTFSDTLMSPISFFKGSGSLRMIVGTANIWSLAASCGLLQEIYDLDLVLALQMLLADLPQVLDRFTGLVRLASHVNTQLPLLRGFIVAFFRRHIIRLSSFYLARLSVRGP